MRSATDWLVNRKILAPLSESLWDSHEHALGAWGPGENWTAAVVEPVPGAWLNSPGEEVAIESARQVYTAMGNSEDFVCAQCGGELRDDLGELIEEWLDVAEPHATCTSCGWTAALGDWPSEHPPALVGGPAITFYRWPLFKPEFVADLTARLGGGRTRHFWTHF
jgi:hypothetical protein